MNKQASNILFFCIILRASTLCAQDMLLYQNDFENAEAGTVPTNFMVLSGGFAVKQDGTNKLLELPGAPLDSFAVQFGPAERADCGVSARIRASGKGRRFPTFGIGLNGIAGYKLQLAPAKNELQLLKDEAIKASVPYEWKSGLWLNLVLQVRSQSPGEWKIEGKVWAQGTPEPANWLVSTAESEEPLAGRASVFGSPFSGTPIDFDDLVVTRVKSKP